MGCPIRKSSDQRVFAPPRRLSQRITSFIACACQGIHQMPLRHLITLIANIHQNSLFAALCDAECCHSTANACLIISAERPASRDTIGGAVRLPIIMQGLSKLLRHQPKVDPITSSLHYFIQNRQIALSNLQTRFFLLLIDQNPSYSTPKK